MALQMLFRYFSPEFRIVLDPTNPQVLNADVADVALLDNAHAANNEHTNLIYFGTKQLIKLQRSMRKNDISYNPFFYREVNAVLFF